MLSKAKAMTLFTYPQAIKFMRVRLGFIQNNRSNAERSEEASAGYLLYLAVSPNISLLMIRMSEPDIQSILGINPY